MKKLIISFIFFLVAFNLYAQQTNLSISTDKLASGVTIFTLTRDNITIDTLIGSASRGTTLIDYKFCNDSSIILIYKDLFGVHYNNIKIKNDIWRSGLSSGYIIPFAFDYINNQDNIEPEYHFNSDISYKIIGVDDIIITYQGNEIFVDFDKRTQDRKEWLKSMEKIRSERLEREKQEKQEKQEKK